MNLKINPKKKELEEILTLYKKKQFTEGEIKIKKLIDVYSKSFFLYNLLGVFLNEQNKIEEAINSYKNAIKLKPDYSDAYYNLATIYKKTFRFKEAIQNYEESLKRKPEDTHAYFNIGLMFESLGKFDEAINYLKKALKINDHLPGVHFQLGIFFKKINRFEEAVNSFNQTIQINPNHEGAHFNLGTVLENLDKINDAVNEYQHVLKLNPDNSIAKHLLNSLNGKTTPKPPDDYVIDTFDYCADIFDYHLVQKLNYKIPQKIFKLVKKTYPQDHKFVKVLDLGCGTGLSGKMFKPFSKELTGIDLSKKMIEKAKSKKIYNNLEQIEILQFLNKTTKLYDLFLATDVFIYVGELEKIFSKILEKSTSNAKFCFSIEECKDKEFKLLQSARYAHSKKYIERISQKYGFTIKNFLQTEIRNDKKKSIRGYIFILEKRNKK